MPDADPESPPEPVHDLGGRPGFGPVPVDDDVIFHAEWERRAFAVTQLAQRASSFNTDAFRHGVEREDPTLYLSIPYFHKWIRNGERMLVEGGVLSPDAVMSRIAGVEPTGDVVRTTDATAPLARGTLRQIDDLPAFSVGESVEVRSDLQPIGHTRLPGYVRGRRGVVDRLQQAWIFPDTHAHGLGEQPTWVYAVRFEAADLWPDAEDHAVYVDLFEPYLEKA